MICAVALTQFMMTTVIGTTGIVMMTPCDDLTTTSGADEISRLRVDLPTESDQEVLLFPTCTSYDKTTDP